VDNKSNGVRHCTENTEDPFSPIFFYFFTFICLQQPSAALICLHLPSAAFISLHLPSLERLQKGSLAGFLREGAGLAGEN
jgi:hypothetical protein